MGGGALLKPAAVAALLAVAFIGAAGELAHPEVDQPWTLHTAIATECTRYFTWQTIGLVHSLRTAGHLGPVTRLMSCTLEDYEKLPEVDKELEQLVPTRWAPSYTVHPRTGDVYPGINKPVAVVDWLAKVDVREDYILVIDADMIMRRPMLPQELGAGPGWAVSGFFGYMQGVDNALALRHVPEVEPRQDSLAGPEGRRGDQVGGFTLMGREDLKRVGPLWVKYSEDVRHDPEAWNLTGDAYATKDEKPWIAEMYGYSFGAAKADVWHRTHTTAMLYPGYAVTREYLEDPPRVLHYGIYWEVNGTDYSFDKHWHYNFDALACPPWNMSLDPRQSSRGLFAHPPRPSAFQTRGEELMRDLLAVEVIITLNAAFCELHRKRCPPSPELEQECGWAEYLAEDLHRAFARLERVAQEDARSAAAQQHEAAPSGEDAGAEVEAAEGTGAEAAAGTEAEAEAEGEAGSEYLEGQGQEDHEGHWHPADAEGEAEAGEADGEGEAGEPYWTEREGAAEKAAATGQEQEQEQEEQGGWEAAAYDNSEGEAQAHGEEL